MRESAREADEHAAAEKLEREQEEMKAIMAEDYWTVAQRLKVSVVVVDDVEVKVAVAKEAVTEAQIMDLDEVSSIRVTDRSWSSSSSNLLTLTQFPTLILALHRWISTKTRG
jgi:hypothetical protein